jgi:type II secretory pathway component PulF
MYAEQAKFGQARLQAVLMPTMIVTIGVIIGLCILSLFLPLVQIIWTIAD